MTDRDPRPGPGYPASSPGAGIELLPESELPARPRRRRSALVGVLVTVVVIAVAVTAGILLWPRPDPAETEIAGPEPSPPAETNPAFEPRPLFDDAAHSIDDPESVWVVVNKLRPFTPLDWVPSDLVPVDVPYVNQPYMRSEAAAAVERMFDDFQAQTGLEMQALSTYRSYAAQQQVYGGNDLLTARPGYSEHQTGWVIDVDANPRVCSLQQCFESTPQGQWLAAQAWEYGFLLRYPAGLTHITGYQYEPWHFRYIGTELAAEMRERGVQTMEEFFDLPPAPNYR